LGQQEIDAVVTIWQAAEPALQERSVDPAPAARREVPALEEALAA